MKILKFLVVGPIGLSMLIILGAVKCIEIVLSGGACLLLESARYVVDTVEDLIQKITPNKNRR